MSMYAAIFHQPLDLRVEQVAIPHVGEGDVLIEVEATGICGSDIRVYKGEKAARPGNILGHEVAGTAEKTGNKVTGVEVGTRVTIYPVVFCGRCHFCLGGHPNMCEHRATLGYQLDGGMAEHMLVPASMVSKGNMFKIPDKVPFEHAAVTEPLACTVNSIDLCRVRTGSSVLIIGAGPMGLMNLLVARAAGASKIIISEVNPDRLRIAKELGADVVVDPTKERLIEAVQAATNGHGVDAAIPSVGLPDAIEAALPAVKKRGIINIFAGSSPDAKITFNPNIIHYNELTLTANQNAPPRCFSRALELMSSKQVDVSKLITHRFALKDVPEAFRSRIERVGLKPIVIPKPHGG